VKIIKYVPFLQHIQLLSLLFKTQTY